MPKQYAALPFRMSRSKLEILLITTRRKILLITTRRKGRWSVPKGTVAGVDDPRRVAEIEAYEEAGVRGVLSDRAIGGFRHRKLKGKRRLKMDVSVFPMQVRRQCATWPEMLERDALWLPVSDAADLVHKRRLRLLIRRFAKARHVMPEVARGRAR